MTEEVKVCATWDGEAAVWVATSEDIPGLVIEAGTIESLLERLKVIIPELMELNGRLSGREIPFHLYSERVDVARVS